MNASIRTAAGPPSPVPIVVLPMAPEHIHRVVAIHSAAFPGHTLTQLGSRFLHQYYRSLLADQRGLALVIVREGAVCGFATGILGPAGFYRDLYRHHAWRFLWSAIPGVLRRPGLSLKLAAAPRFAELHPSNDQDATLSSIAVAPGNARCGLGRQLFEAFCALVIARGGVCLAWGVKASEGPAVAFYESLAGADRRSVRGLAQEQVFEYRLSLRAEGVS